MVHPQYRGMNIMSSLSEPMMRLYPELPVRGLHLYAVSRHEITQRKSQDAGAPTTGILLEDWPASPQPSVRCGYTRPAPSCWTAPCRAWPPSASINWVRTGARPALRKHHRKSWSSFSPMPPVLGCEHRFTHCHIRTRRVLFASSLRL